MSYAAAVANGPTVSLKDQQCQNYASSLVVTLGSSLDSHLTEAIMTMLNFGEPLKKGHIDDKEPVWKILVYDRIGQDIISPLLKVSELRDLGITLHLLLHSDREVVADVAAIYFVMATNENITRITKDIQEGLYDKIYINFISSVSRDQLETLATVAVESNSVAAICGLQDQYLNYLCLENDLFIVREHNREAVSYFALNNPKADETSIKESLDVIVDSLFSVFVSLGSLPIIKCLRGGNAAAMVSQSLEARMREHLKNKRNNLFLEASSTFVGMQRPLLLVVDRNMDLNNILEHTWTYQALVHDLLDYKLNRVRIGNGTAGVKVKAYDMDSKDRFWSAHRGSPFPTVATDVESELNEYKAAANEVSRLSGALEMQSLNEDGSFPDSTKLLSSAFSSMPELVEKKRIVDQHTIIASSLLEQIKSRQLDMYFDYEEHLLAGTSTERPVLEVLKDVNAGTPEDKLRLFVMYYLTRPEDLPSTELEACLSTLIDLGVDTSLMAYLKNLRDISRMSSASYASSTAASAAPVGSSGMFGMTRFKDIKTVLSQGSELFKQGVKNLLPSKKALQVTKLLADCMEGKDDCQTLDPKAVSGAVVSSTKGVKPTYSHVIVFVVGGGSYAEYQNIVDFVKGSTANPSLKSVTYGATELLSAKQLLTQLQALGVNSK